MSQRVEDNSVAAMENQESETSSIRVAGEKPPAAPPEIEYPSGMKLGIIVSGLLLSSFLVSGPSSC